MGAHTDDGETGCRHATRAIGVVGQHTGVVVVKQVRVDSDGLANLVYGRDVTPDLEGLIDALSISLNAQNEEIYERHCRPTLPHSYAAMLEFADRARDFVPDITMTAIDGLEGVDIAACEDVARRLGVKFRRRVLNDVG